jgi:DNA mismatch endonuclease (patch repair protein)
MPDMFTKEKRKEIMSKIRSKGTKIELKMQSALMENEITFQYQPKMLGNPDFFIPPKIVVFCDSSFWHGRDWGKLGKKLPSGYWYNHIKRNRKRDKIINSLLKKNEFYVLRFWDDEIEKEIDKCIEKIRRTMEKISRDSRIEA